MNRGVSRFIPIIFIIVIVVLVIAAAVSIFQMAIGNNDEINPEQADITRSSLLSTDEARSVRMTVRGEIVGNENFRTYRITVSPENRSFVRYKGYLDTPMVEKEYTNNTKAYEEFVYALDRAGLSKGKELSTEENDIRGICADGVVYEFDILDGTRVVKHLWTTNCRGIDGSLQSDTAFLQQLFLEQTPDASEYIGKD